MRKDAKSSLYDEVLKVTRFYIGPAARRFIDRQIANHLDINSEKLAKQDLAKLTDWICLALALVAEDKYLVDSCSADLIKLAK